MKKVSLFKLYFFLFWSSGLYGFIWLYHLIGELENRYAFKNKYVIGKKLTSVLVIGFLGLLLLGALLYGGSPGKEKVGGESIFLFFLIPMAFAVQASLLTNLVIVNTFLKKNIGLKTPNNFFVLIFYFLFFLSPIKIQSTINNYIEWEEPI